jgi:hypothetical protein
MWTVNHLCAVLVVIGYILFGILGILLEWKLRPHINGLTYPLNEAAISSQDGKRLFRYDKLWRKARIPVWIGSIAVAWLLCSR